MGSYAGPGRDAQTIRDLIRTRTRLGSWICLPADPVGTSTSSRARVSGCRSRLQPDHVACGPAARGRAAPFCSTTSLPRLFRKTLMLTPTPRLLFHYAKLESIIAALSLPAETGRLDGLRHPEHVLDALAGKSAAALSSDANPLVEPISKAPLVLRRNSPNWAWRLSSTGSAYVLPTRRTYFFRTACVSRSRRRIAGAENGGCSPSGRQSVGLPFLQQISFSNCPILGRLIMNRSSTVLLYPLGPCPGDGLITLCFQRLIILHFQP